ncbi:MAG: ACT domain-containing protein [Betaproteobacteria bacterium]|jgi:hypothetical protein
MKLMSPAVSDLAFLIGSMGPELYSGAQAYCVVPKGTDVSALSPVATVAESEGLSPASPCGSRRSDGWHCQRMAGTSISVSGATS